MWLLYGSFGLLMVVSVVADMCGVLSANLQVRLFPHLLLVGIPLASDGIAAAVESARRNRTQVTRRLVPVVLVILITFFSLASLLKITNQPLVSNWWSFYSFPERLSVEWMANMFASTIYGLGRMGVSTPWLKGMAAGHRR